MPSLLSRLRSRAVSLSTTTSTTSSPTTPTASTSPTSPLPVDATSVHSTHYLSPVDRRIHPNLDSLLEDYSAQLEQEPDPSVSVGAGFGISLKPNSPRTHSAYRSRPKAHTRLSRQLSANKGATPATLDDVDEIMEPTASIRDHVSQSPTPDPASGDDPSRTRRILEHISYLASPSEWSTFGRNRNRPSPRLDNFDEQSPEVGAARHSRLENIDFSTVTVRRSRSSPRRRGTGTNASSSVHSESIVAGRSRNTSSPSTTTAPPTSQEVPSTTPSRKSSFKHPENQSHESRTNDSKHSSVSSSKNHTATTPTRSRPNTSNSAAHDLDSPHTFGYPTPPDIASAFTFGSRSGYGSDSSPPPLPPFNHPELAAALRAKSGTTAALSEKGPRHGRDTIYESPNDRTFPQRSPPNNEIPAFSSLPSFSLGKLRSRSKSSPSLPQVQQIFAPPLSSATPPDPARTNASPGKRTSPRSRPRTRARATTVSGRRLSADWSAKEAASGGRFSWPAQVSREILRLSFGVQGAAQEPGARGQHVGVEDHSLPQGTTFYPVTFHQSPNFPLSESLGSPFSEAGAVGHNLSDNLYYDHSSMVGSEKAPIPTAAVTSSKNVADGSKSSGKGKSSSRQATPSPPKKGAASTSSQTNVGPSTPSRPTISGPSPASEPLPGRSSRFISEPSPSVLQVGATPMRQTASTSSTVSKGKRKAEEVEGTPPDQKKEIQRATFSIPPRPHRASATSGSSHAPSSYHRKRPRLSAPTSLTSPTESSSQKLDAGNTGSWASRASSTRPTLQPRPSSRAASRAASSRSNPPERLPRSSMSQVSIPISALISPHAPSLGRSSTFHMSDPRKPPRTRATGWSLRLGTRGEPGSGSPLHAWCFFLGFVVFPLWWLASFRGTPQTRLVGGTDVEKAVTLDDPQVELDAKSWRLRCRVMSGVSLITYIPFIVLVAIFVPQ